MELDSYNRINISGISKANVKCQAKKKHEWKMQQTKDAANRKTVKPESDWIQCQNPANTQASQATERQTSTVDISTNGNNISDH